jgi:hypothetical protein
MMRTICCISFLLVLLASPAQGQQRDTGAAVSFDSAQAIRGSLRQPPQNPPFDAADAAALPVRIVTFPLLLLSRGIAELGDVGAGLKGSFANVFGPNRIGLSVLVGTIGPSSGIGAGLRFVGLDPVFVETSFSIFGSQRHRIGVLLTDGDGRLEGAYMFQRNRRVRFWGIGPATSEESETDFGLDISDAAVDGELGVLPGAIELTAGVAFEDDRAGRGSNDQVLDLQDAVTGDTLFGLRERVNYLRFKLGAELDLTHTVAGLQRRGLFLQGTSWFFRGVDGTDSDFHRLRGGVAGYLPLNLRQSLAVRLLAETNRRDGGHGIPFFRLASVGAEDGSRAFPAGRFRGRDMAALMMEWRYEVWRELHGRGRAEGFVFFDDGGAEHTLSDLDWVDLHESYGFGLRGIWQGQLRALTYLAFGSEGTRLQAAFSWTY